MKKFCKNNKGSALMVIPMILMLLVFVFVFLTNMNKNYDTYIKAGTITEVKVNYGFLKTGDQTQLTFQDGTTLTLNGKIVVPLNQTYTIQYSDHGENGLYLMGIMSGDQ